MNGVKHQLGERILIIGCAGSGKTTLSRKLHQKLNLPIIHLDKYFWKANWGRPKEEEWQHTVQALSEQKSWIMDGSYSDTLPIRLQYATSVIFIDVSRWLCLLRVIIRRFRFFHNRKRVDIPKDCRDRLNLAFYRWIWNYPAHSRVKILNRLSQFEGPVFQLKTKSDLKHLVESVNTNE